MALLKRKRVGLNDAMSVVTRFVNACNRHDADGVAACLHPDFDSIQPMYPLRNFRGADQVRRNWQAIFDAEPGFRLTVLRSASLDDTVWLELHGAGREAEVAGVFVMGIQGDRIRWARIYSALVEPVPAGMEGQPAPLHEVRQPDDAPATGGDMVEEDMIAPVLDIERSGRRRRRRRSEDLAAGAEEGESSPADEADAAPEPLPDQEVEALGVVVPGDTPGIQAVAVVELAVVEVEPGVEVATFEVLDVIDAGAAPASAEAEPAGAADGADDGGPPTEAVEMVALTEAEEGPAEPGAEVEAPAPASPAPPEPPRRLFGKRPRA